MKPYLALYLIMSLELVHGCPTNCSCVSTTVNCTAKQLEHIPADLPNTATKLYLNINKILAIEECAFANMTNLEELSLSNNEITAMKQNAFVNLVNLKYIYLNNNKLKVVEEYIFANLRNLEQLELQYNEISVIQRNAFVNLVNLKVLYLHDNALTVVNTGLFFGLDSLITLVLVENNISLIENGAFDRMPNLARLYLNDNALTVINTGLFYGLDSLIGLELDGNNISLIENGAFGSNPSLEELEFGSYPLNCDCSIKPFWSWLTNKTELRTNAKCSDGTDVINIAYSELLRCTLSTCQCYNGGICITGRFGEYVCSCVGDWTGERCLESQCTSNRCGEDTCYVEPNKGTAKCFSENNECHV